MISLQVTAFCNCPEQAATGRNKGNISHVVNSCNALLQSCSSGYIAPQNLFLFCFNLVNHEKNISLHSDSEGFICSRPKEPHCQLSLSSFFSLLCFRAGKKRACPLFILRPNLCVTVTKTHIEQRGRGGGQV